MFTFPVVLLALAPPAQEVLGENATPPPTEAPLISDVRNRVGWRELFDGDTLAGWRGYGKAQAPAGWSVQDGALHLDPALAPGDLVTTATYENFELEFEWRAAAGANSGVKSRVKETAERGSPLGPEYQILANSASELESTGALYALHPAPDAAARPAGDWNRARVVYRGSYIEHWLNGVRLFALDMESDDWRARKATSKFKNIADFGLGAGHIALQDHGGEVSFRNLRVRDWDEMPGTPVTLFPGSGTEGWRELGDALWTRTPNGIAGAVGGGGQSFLVTERKFSDFILELELKIDAGNSGVQIRSHVRENGTLFGYQIEIDPTERAWSGGLYDEGRNGWLDDSSEKPAARAAFDKDDWNLYRIEAVGTSIRTWVNGIPVADYNEATDAEGVLGLQVHSGRDCRVAWRELAMWNLAAEK